MANIASSVTELIGRTPLLRLKNIEEKAVKLFDNGELKDLD